MKNLNELLLAEFKTHPKMEITDAIKFVYQSVCGCGHMISDEASSFDKLLAEMKADDAYQFEEITPLSGGYCRIGLSCLKKGLSPATLNKLFVLSAEIPAVNAAALKDALSAIYILPFKKELIDKYIFEYITAGMPTVSHSETYRREYHPHYRVVKQEYAKLLPVLRAIDSMEDGIVAIDGMCGSGKSTLADKLIEIYDCNLFHMDDFFLPFERKTPQRLAEPGGNVDYERFLDEVLLPLSIKNTVQYRPYKCSLGKIDSSTPITYKPLNIIEGSYSMHPKLASFYDLKIFLKISPDEQIARIEKRNGPEMANHFKSVWIPLENTYFNVFNIEKQCDLILT